MIIDQKEGLVLGTYLRELLIADSDFVEAGVSRALVIGLGGADGAAVNPPLQDMAHLVFQAVGACVVLEIGVEEERVDPLQTLTTGAKAPGARDAVFEGFRDSFVGALWFAIQLEAELVLVTSGLVIF